MAYGYDASILERMMPRIKQWETTMGRRMPATMYESMMKGAFGAEADKGQRERALDLQTQEAQDRRDAADDAASAAKTKGYIDTASTAGMGYLTYKAVTKPSEMSELIAYQKSLAGTGGGATQAIPSAGSFAQPFAGSPYATVNSGGAYTAAPAFTGAQTSFGGGATAVGGQAALAGSGEVGSLAAYDASAAAGAGGVGSTVGTAAGVGAPVYLGPVAAGYVGGGIGHRLADKFSPIGGEKEKRIVGGIVGGAAAGAVVGSAILPGPGTAVGAFIGGVVGGVREAVNTVICSELLRQKKITDKDRNACVFFRAKHISVPMFVAYLEWAEPIVRLMRTNKVANFLLLPFAMNFVGYMLSVQADRKPTITEKLAWKYAWYRCKRIADSNTTTFTGDIDMAGVK